jgi:hypothetical protein
MSASSLTNPFETLIAGEADSFVLSHFQLDLSRGRVSGAVHYRDQGRMRHISQTIELDRLERCDPFAGDEEQVLELNERYLRSRGTIAPDSTEADIAPVFDARIDYVTSRPYRLTMANGSNYEGTVVGVREGQRTLVLVQLADSGATVALAQAEIARSEAI